MSWIGAAVSVGGTVVGGLFNANAAGKASAAAKQAAAIEAQSIREGRAAAQNELAHVREENAPGQNYLRGVVAAPGDLTPAQQMRLEDLRRSTGNQIRTSAIAGSGRTAASLLRRVESDFTNNALETNRDRAFGAASGMAGRVGNASTAIAGLDASMIPAAGKAEAGGIAKGGLYQAGSELATGKLIGSGLGEIGSLIAQQNKASKYGSGAPLGWAPSPNGGVLAPTYGG